jgi:hypothetical protein
VRLGRHPHHRPPRRLPALAGGLRRDRTPRRRQRADSAGRNRKPCLRLGLPGRPADVGRPLRRAPVPPSVHDEGARLLGARGRRRARADDVHVRGGVVRSRPALRPGRRQAHHLGRRSLHRSRHLPALAARHE